MHYILTFILLLGAPFFVAAHDTNLQSPLRARVHATADTLHGISDRIDARATIFAQTGLDTSGVRPLLETARASLDAADALIGMEEQAETQSIVAHLLSAHANLMGALEVLKSADASVSSEEILGAPEVH